MGGELARMEPPLPAASYNKKTVVTNISVAEDIGQSGQMPGMPCAEHESAG